MTALSTHGSLIPSPRPAPRVGDSTEAARSVAVTFVSAHAEIGGGEVYLESLLQALDPGWVTSIVLLEEGPLVERLRGGGFHVKVVESPGRRGVLTGAWGLRRELRRNRSQVVHANGFKAAAAAALATAGTRLPVVWAKIDSARDGKLARAVALGCDQIVGISESVLETFGPRIRRRTRVVHPGVPAIPIDRTAGRRLVRTILDVDDEAQVVVLSGRICPPKGQLDLIEIAPAMLKRHPRARLALLGAEDTSYAGFQALLKRRAGELGVEHAVSFLGHRSEAITSVADAVRFVSGCDLLVAPSQTDQTSGWREGFGLAPVEALTVGTPVVAYRHGSLPEVLGDCALLVPEGDRHELAHAITRVLSDPDLSARMAACGRARSARYSMPSWVTQMKQVYRESARSERERPHPGEAPAG